MTRREILNLLPDPLFKWVTGLKRDVLFFWVPKCAGTSVYSTLLKHGCPAELWLDPTRRFANRGISTFGHVSIPKLVEAQVIKRRYLENAFKFGFVRNPFDRVVSLYFYLQKTNCLEVPETMSFAAFCRQIDRQEFPPVGLYNRLGLNQCNPMVDWLLDQDGRMLVDFVGRHETVAGDFEKICRVIGIQAQIPHENKTAHRPYREYYATEARAIVERVYRQDLDTFGYGF